ncbi:IMPACT family protein [Deinococcus misasensis]|uniref:IMPACT family protein n=1 Tax=Deinococcus misasensis TaxID=392413 RepID=UPI0005516FCD|nr:YigZ family protein [Deinococcus misasensis]
MVLFTTLKHPTEHQEDIKGSDFLVYASRADTPESALQFVQAIRQKHPEATHVCWAYKIEQQYRFNDDGEPGGTAGQPILRAIEGQGLDHTVVAVVRYYGGTKLGAGGLARAYGGTAAEALRLAEKHQELPRVQLSIQVPFELANVMYRLLENYTLFERSDEYTDQGLTLHLTLLASEVEALEIQVRDASRGQASWTVHS